MGRGRRGAARLVEPGRELGDVGEPGAMREQVANRDHLPARRDARKVALERVVQTKAALLYELEHDRRGERLRHAPDPEPLVGAGPPASGGCLVLTAVVGDEDDHAIAAGVGDLTRELPDGRRGESGSSPVHPTSTRASPATSRRRGPSGPT